MSARRRLPKVKVFAVLPDPSRTRHLVWRGTDPQKSPSDFHRLLGGHLELGETLVDGVLREIHEETATTLEAPRLLGFLENRYVFEGEPGHEIVFVYTGDLADPDVVGPEGGWLTDNGEPIRVEWRGLPGHETDADLVVPLHPPGLTDLIRERMDR